MKPLLALALSLGLPFAAVAQPVADQAGTATVEARDADAAADATTDVTADAAVSAAEAAAGTTPAEPATVDPATAGPAPADPATAAAAPEGVAKAAPARFCLQETGSHIRRRAGKSSCESGPGRGYSREDLQRSGINQLGGSSPKLKSDHP